MVFLPPLLFEVGLEYEMVSGIGLAVGGVIAVCVTFIQQQLAQLQQDIHFLQEKHPQLQAFSLQQYQLGSIGITEEFLTSHHAKSV